MVCSGGNQMFNRKVSIWVIPLVVILTVSMTVIGMAWGLQKVTHNAEGALRSSFIRWDVSIPVM